MNADTEWVLIDTETDGLYAPIHVIEIAAQRMRGLAPDGPPFHRFINHNVEIPAEAVAIHGYSSEYIKNVGQDPLAVYTALRGYIANRLIGSHYLRFDFDMALYPEWCRLGIQSLGDRGLCTWYLSRRVIHETANHKLDTLRDMFRLKCSRPHSASGDLESTVDLLTRVIAPRLSNIGITSIEHVRAFSRELPLRKCLCRVQGRDYDLEQKEKRRIRGILDSIQCGLVDNLPKIVLEEDIIDESPVVTFPGKVFLFTGKMKWGTRAAAQQVVESLGGTLAKSKTITAGLDYLVLGEDRDAGWTSLLDGGKLNQAIHKKLSSQATRLKVILETDFIAAVNNSRIPPQPAPSPYSSPGAGSESGEA